MNTNQLECFIAVAENLNFSKASNKLHISQPAISHQIQSLENELNIALFSRTNKRVELTNAGIQFLPEAIKILDIENHAKSKLSNLSINKTILLEICCHTQMELDLIPYAIKELKSEYPNVNPIIRFISTLTDEQLLERDIVQITFGIKDKLNNSQIVYEELGKIPISLVCSHQSPLAKLEAINIKDIDEAIILSHQQHAPDAIVKMQNDFLKKTKQINTQYCETFEIITTLVKSEIGVTIRPDIPFIRDPQLSYLPLKEFDSLSFGVYYKKNSQQEIQKKFIKILKNFFKKKKKDPSKN